jgi:hypothetical protein
MRQNLWDFISTLVPGYSCLADLTTSSNLSRLSSMEQLIFFLLKDSEAAPKTDISVAPAAT